MKCLLFYRVNWDLEVKVADFDLSKVMTEGKDYYRTDQGGPLPVRWMSPESLLDLVFTMKSGVVRSIAIWLCFYRRFI